MSEESFIKKIAAEIQETKIAKGWKITTEKDWEDPHEIPACLMLIVSEASEALEEFRKDNKEKFSDEIADILIRTIGLAHGLNLDIEEIISKKVAENKTRSYRHGGKKV